MGKKIISSPMTPKEKEQLFELYREEMPVREIAEKLNRKRPTISQAISRAVKKGQLESRKKGPMPKPKGEAVYKQIRTVIFLDADTHKLLKFAAVLWAKPMSEIARDALQKELKSLKDKMPEFFGKRK